MMKMIGIKLPPFSVGATCGRPKSLPNRLHINKEDGFSTFYVQPPAAPTN